jgi:uncharacterized protein YjbJ (UPF0337 family)
MGQSTEELSQEIAETRRSMSSNVDALQDKVSPSAMVERRKAAARSRLQSARERVMGTARDTGSSAAGAAASAKDSAQETLGSVKDSAQNAASSTQERIEGAPIAAGLVAFGAGLVLASLIPASDKEARAAAKVLDVAEEKGGPLVDEARSVGHEVAHDVADKASEAVQTVKEAAAESSERLASEGRSAVDETRSEASH